MSAALDENGLEDAAILLMSIGEEEAAEVFRHLEPREVQRLGETISRMKSISREKVEGVLAKFASVASEQSVLAPTPTSTSRTCCAGRSARTRPIC